MARIDCFFSTISPFAYLAGKRLDDIAQKHQASVTYKPVDIMGLFARTGGTAPKERHVSRQQYRAQELVRQAAKLGLALNEKPAFWPTNAAPSAYAIIAAQREGGGDISELVHSILRACWAEERDISDDAVIRDCLSAANFDPDLADRGLLAGAETYAANLEEAVKRGVFGSPFYMTDTDQRFFGQDRLADLDLSLSGKI